MALLRNREVQILGKTDGQDESPTYTVLYPDGNRENVRLNQLRVTEEEQKELQKANGELTMSNVKVVKAKDLQEIRDGQDKAKIEEKQKKNPQSQDVEVSKIKVNAVEVAQKAK
jgi:hypothetical protein